jgi:hypothetical protein
MWFRTARRRPAFVVRLYHGIPLHLDEIQIPIRYNSDHKLPEEIVSKAAQRHTLSFQDLNEQAVQQLERRHSVKREQIRPTIYYRLTDNWLELTGRFITPYYGTRELKDAISRDTGRIQGGRHR